MTFLQWRRFNFFEKEILDESKDALLDLAKSCQITCSSPGNGFLVLGDSSGMISLVSRLHVISSFTAYKIAVTHCCYMRVPFASAVKGGNKKTTKGSSFYVVTVGTDSDDLIPILKIWAVTESAMNASPTAVKSQTISESMENQSDSVQEQTAPVLTNAVPLANCIRTIKLCSSTSPLNTLRVHAFVTALDVLGDSLIALGFNDGHCLLIKGELVRDKNLKMTLIEVAANDSITNVAFANNPKFTKPTQALSKGSKDGGQKMNVPLFVATRREICSYMISSGRDQQEKMSLDSFGCEIGASCMKCDPKQLDIIQFVVGRKDAIYFYNVDGRGPCLAFEGQKLFLHWFRNYLVVVTCNDASLTPGSSVLANPNPNTLTIYDIDRKFIAFSCPVPAVSQVVSEWGVLYAFTVNGQVVVFKERDTQTKLELLFAKNQFSMAIDLAKTQTYNQDVLADMFKQYGDHLYRNGDYDGAINQYCQTLGYLEPSYVIRKFLDLQRIHNLTTYLQEIHKRDLATEDHTTLLINCYVKLKDEEKLNEFLRSSDIVFDVDIAIRVLRQAGYYDNAVMLARKHGRFDSYFSILLEDKADCGTALDTFAELLHEDRHAIISQYLSKYGRCLMVDEPDKTTELLKSLCLFDMEQQLAQLKQLANADHNDGPKNPFEEKTSDPAPDVSFIDIVKSKYKPEKYLHIFLNHPTKLVEFLEFLMDRSRQMLTPDGQPMPLPMEISNTLLEMYMHSYKNEIREDGLAENRNKIMNFLSDPDSNYDVKKAMILCQMSNFVPGVLFLYEKAKMFKQILVHYINCRDSQNVIETCKKYGKEELSLWIEALQYFAEIHDDSQKENISFILENIEKHQLLPPLTVVEILSKPGKVTLGVVRNYLMRWIKSQQMQIDENEKLIDSFRDECQRIRKQIEDIREKPRVFQATKCTACSHQLELPSIHFMCGHSYHMACVDSYTTEQDDQECPYCLSENRKILNEISMYDNVKNVDELFQKELMNSKDPFEVIARYCSHGLFDPLTIVTDDGLIQTGGANSAIR